jgi:hypothetical protein
MFYLLKTKSFNFFAFSIICSSVGKELVYFKNGRGLFSFLDISISVSQMYLSASLC